MGSHQTPSVSRGGSPSSSSSFDSLSKRSGAASSSRGRSPRFNLASASPSNPGGVASSNWRSASPSDQSSPSPSERSSSPPSQGSTSAPSRQGSAGSSTSKQKGPANTNGRGKGRDMPWADKNAIAWKRRNLESMWNSQAALVSRRKTDHVMILEPGALLSTAHHSPNSETNNPSWMQNTDTIPWDEPYRTATPFGVVYSKYRKFVVVWEHENHYTCLPIYTHKGKGVETRRQAEHITIRDSRSDTAAPLEPGDVHGCLVAEMASIRSAESGNARSVSPALLSPSASIHLTNFVTIWRDTPLTYEGRLIANDVKRLKGIVLSLLD